MRSGWFIVPWVLAALLVVVGCDRAGSARSAGSTRSVQSVGGDGPIRVTLSVDPTAITTAGRSVVRLEARLAPGLSVKEIDLSKSLPEGLSVVDSRFDARLAEGGSSLVVREWVVEPFLAGEYAVGPITVEATEKDANKEASGGSRAAPEPVRTEAVKIAVASVLKAGEEEMAAAKPVVDPPYETPVWVWWSLGGLAVLLAGTAWFIAARRRRAARGPEPVFAPAHEVALRRMSELMSRKLVEAGRFKEFYEEASLILRRYIEDRFGLHAPERTTEEFLAETRSSSALMEEDVRVLRRFLGHCDLVKFAAVIPSTPEAEGVAATVREFVERTRDVEKVVRIDVPSGGVGA
ncbi:MAG: hypothetical protein JNK58_03115 [Phycisphaerae bacterium]|nr:hypothetical protein [Phycisphaerae bacterium]